MSLTKTSLWNVVKKQFHYRRKAYVQVFMSLFFTQMIALLLSFNGVGMMGTSSDTVEINVHYYSADIVVALTILWGFITAILITTKVYRMDDFAFVTNRLSSNLANFLFLLLASIVGGVTSMLSTYLIRVIMLFVMKHQTLMSGNVGNPTSDLLLGIWSTTFYILLFCALGYLVGTLIQIHKVFSVLLPVLFFGLLILGGISGEKPAVQRGFEFFFSEPSLPLFLCKVLISVLLLFLGATLLSNRMEVKQ